MGLDEVLNHVGIILIASENFTSSAVMQAVGSPLMNKYSEGYPGKRYYGGCMVIDKIEDLCRQRALQAFGADPEKWHVNVQALSGAPANFAVYTALVPPGGKIMGLDLTCGGHLSHGFQTPKRKVSATSMFWDSSSYGLKEDGYIDYDGAYETAQKFKPNIVICGYSAYPRDLDYKRFREIADSVGALLLADIAHFSGLVVSKQLKSPFEYADVVTTTTHKSLRGPRGSLIFCKKELAEQLDDAVFPKMQGGPHNHSIGGISVALHEALQPEFNEYSKRIIANSKALAKAMMNKGHTLVTDGTDNHIILWNLRPHGLTGSKLETVANHTNVTLNKNTIAGDKSAMTPHGIRLGTPACTTRGYTEKHMEDVAEFLDRICKASLKIQSGKGKKLNEFVQGVEESDEVKQISNDVAEFASQFEWPGVTI